MSELVDVVGRADPRWLLVAFLAAIDVWAISLLVASPAGAREKALWTAVIVLCPIVGCLLWYVLGPKPNLLRAGRRGAGER